LPCVANCKIVSVFEIVRPSYDWGVRDLAVLFLHLLVTVGRLAAPGGARSVVAEAVLVKHQLLILNRSRKRAPNLRTSDRVVAGLCALVLHPGRLIRCEPYRSFRERMEPMARPSKYSPELRERAVHLVFDHAHEHPSQWATIRSVAEKLGCTVEALPDGCGKPNATRAGARV
jgi:hypothetical protein